LNGTKAAERIGCSKKSARTLASRLLRNVAVQEKIAALAKRNAEELEISSKKVLQEIAALAFCNIDDFITIDADGQPHWDLSGLSRMQMKAIQEITVEEFKDGNGKNARQVRRTKIKLADKRANLELLGRYLKLFNVEMELPPMMPTEQPQLTVVFVTPPPRQDDPPKQLPESVINVGPSNGNR
jgi:phage terminase small subunit